MPDHPLGPSPDRVIVDEPHFPTASDRGYIPLRHLGAVTVPEQVRVVDELRRAAEPVAAMDALTARHWRLVEHHAGHPVVSALLAAHAPHPTGEPGRADCHGCVKDLDLDTGEEIPAWWPCPTWQLIDDTTPAIEEADRG